MIEKLYTVEEVAELASVTGRTIRNYLKSGRLVGRKIGGQWRFPESEVQRLLSGGDDLPDAPPPQDEAPAEDEQPRYNDELPFTAEEDTEAPEDEPAYAPEPMPMPDPAEVQAAAQPQTSAPPQQPNPVTLPPIPPAPTPAPMQAPPPTVQHVVQHVVQPGQPQAGMAQPALQPQVAAVEYAVQPIQQQAPVYAPAPQPMAPTQEYAPQQAYYGAAPAGYPAGYAPAPQPTAPAPASQQGQGQAAPGQPISFEQPLVPQYATPNYAPVGTGQAPPVYGASPTFAYPQPGAAAAAPVGSMATPGSQRQESAPPPVHNEEPAPRREVPPEEESPMQELSDVGKRVAQFVSEVHDCSDGPQMCSVIDMHQSLASAKITSERLNEIAHEESERGPACLSFVEFDARYYIARYTLFGTSTFLSRCLLLIG